MAKKKVRIPKNVLGMKIPRSIRKSSVIQGLLASKTGREMMAHALTAAATAGAGVLVAERKDVAQAAETGLKGSAKGASLVAKAFEAALQAALAELHLSPRKNGKDKDRQDQSRRSSEWASVH